jgi:hypothetical protein
MIILGSFIILFYLGRMLLRERLVFASHPWLLLPIAQLLLVPFMLVAGALGWLMTTLLGMPLSD